MLFPLNISGLDSGTQPLAQLMQPTVHLGFQHDPQHELTPNSGPRKAEHPVDTHCDGQRRRIL